MTTDENAAQSASHVTAEEAERARRRRAGFDRPAWATLVLFCCGDCGWYSTDRNVCPGCGERAPSVVYERRL